MTTDPTSGGNPGDLRSLIDAAAAGGGGKAPGRGVLGTAEERLRAAMGRLRWAEDRKTLLRVGIVALVVLSVGAGAWGVVEFWPRRTPDYLADPMDDILDYTLLTEDFNKLPLEERLKHIKELVQRLKTMSSQDSVLMAAFAANLRDAARKQLEENAKRLAVDMLDDYAKGYKDVPGEDRGSYLDQKALEFTHMMEDLAGESSGLAQDDNERLAQLKRQAKRDEEMLRRGDTRMRADRVAGFLKFMHQDSDKLATPVQQARMVKFTRDMVRHLRGEDVNSPPPAPPTDPGSSDPAGAPTSPSDPDAPADPPADPKKPAKPKRPVKAPGTGGGEGGGGG